jgi:hypothetical protein
MARMTRSPIRMALLLATRWSTTSSPIQAMPNRQRPFQRSSGSSRREEKHAEFGCVIDAARIDRPHAAPSVDEKAAPPLGAAAAAVTGAGVIAGLEPTRRACVSAASISATISPTRRFLIHGQ